jgi:hypothetical protein
MNTPQIRAAAALIADIDPALSRVWLTQPFQRHNVVTAFHRSLSNAPRYAGLADQIAVCLRSVIDASQAGLATQ